MHQDYRSSECYSGDRASLYNELLQDSYLTRNVSHLSGIITLGNLKSNIDWQSVTQVYYGVLLQQPWPSFSTPSQDASNGRLEDAEKYEHSVRLCISPTLKVKCDCFSLSLVISLRSCRLLTDWSVCRTDSVACARSRATVSCYTDWLAHSARS